MFGSAARRSVSEHPQSRVVHGADLSSVFSARSYPSPSDLSVIPRSLTLALCSLISPFFVLPVHDQKHQSHHSCDCKTTPSLFFFFFPIFLCRSCSTLTSSPSFNLLFSPFWTHFAHSPSVSPLFFCLLSPLTRVCPLISSSRPSCSLLVLLTGLVSVYKKLCRRKSAENCPKVTQLSSKAFSVALPHHGFLVCMCFCCSVHAVMWYTLWVHSSLLYCL